MDGSAHSRGSWAIVILVPPAELGDGLSRGRPPSVPLLRVPRLLLVLIHPPDVPLASKGMGLGGG